MLLLCIGASKFTSLLKPGPSPNPALGEHSKTSCLDVLLPPVWARKGGRDRDGQKVEGGARGLGGGDTQRVALSSVVRGCYVVGFVCGRGKGGTVG